MNQYPVLKAFTFAASVEAQFYVYVELYEPDHFVQTGNDKWLALKLKQPRILPLELDFAA